MWCQYQFSTEADRLYLLSVAYRTRVHHTRSFFLWEEYFEKFLDMQLDKKVRGNDKQGVFVKYCDDKGKGDPVGFEGFYE